MSNVMPQISWQFTTQDATSPRIENYSPQGSFVPKDSNIQFDVLDDGSGVDANTIVVSVGGTLAYNGASGWQPGFTGTVAILAGGGYRVTVNPDTDFAESSSVSIDVDASDLSGNVMSTFSWAFTILDGTSPTLTNNFPIGPGAAADTLISFDLSDAGSGVSLAHTVVKLGADTVYDGGFRPGYQGPNSAVTGSPSSYHFVIDPEAVLFPSLYTVTVDSQDLAPTPNVMPTRTWDFSVIDAMAPIIDSIAPDTSSTTPKPHITFTAKDNETGINLSSIVVTVNGDVAFTSGVEQPGFSVNYTEILHSGPFGTVSWYEFYVVRDDNFAELEDVTVSVYVEDLGIPLNATKTWTFKVISTQPVAVITYNNINALFGSMIQLDGRHSYDNAGLPLTFKWAFTKVPYGSAVNPAQTVPPSPDPYPFTSIRPGDTAVRFIPDVLGIYEVTLVVNNGYVDSDPASAMVTIGLSQVPCGEGIVHDASFLWQYISDFWNLVEDKNYLSAAWSGVMQVIGSDLINLWSNDYNKSLATIQNYVPHRWQRFSLRTDLRAESQRIILGDTADGTGATTGSIAPYSSETTIGHGTSANGESFSGIIDIPEFHSLVPGEVKIYQRTGHTDVLVAQDNGSGVIMGVGGYVVSGSVDYATRAITVIESGAVWGIGQDVVVIAEHITDMTNELYVPGVSFANFSAKPSAVGRLFTVNGDGHTISRVYDAGSGGVIISDREDIPGGLSNASWRIPHTLHVPSLDLEDFAVNKGDIIVFDVLRQDIGVSAPLYAQVVGVDRTRVGFEFTLEEVTAGSSTLDIAQFDDLVKDLRIVSDMDTEDNIRAAAMALVSFLPIGINVSDRPFTQYSLVIRAREVIHNVSFRVHDDYVTIPALQEGIHAPDTILRENTDFYIKGGSVRFISPYELKSPSPEVLWAECSMVDNTKAIENNFGALAGVKPADLASTNLTYLSAVKGLWYALTNGPSVANVRLGLQILMGLPFSEERGVVIALDDHFSHSHTGNNVELGRMVVDQIDADNQKTGLRKYYFYPTLVGLEVNPATEEPYKTGDIIERWAPISKGITVTDYVKDPDWWRRSLSGAEILKYFIFHVTINSDVFSEQDTAIAVEFLNKIKPAYTEVLSQAFKSISDDVLGTFSEYFASTAQEAEWNNPGYISPASPLRLSLYDAPDQSMVFKSDALNGQGVQTANYGVHPLSTRSPLLLRDVDTYWSGSDLMAESASGMPPSIRARRVGTATFPVVEGDILAVLPRQQGSFYGSDAWYEIGAVGAQGLTLRNYAPHKDPDSYDYSDISPDTTEVGSGMSASILRRHTNPIIAGDDLVSDGTDTVTSASADFILDEVGVDDHLVIEDHKAEYRVKSVDSGSMTLVNLDGSAAVVTAGTGLLFWILRPTMMEMTSTAAKSIYRNSHIEIEVMDPGNGTSPAPPGTPLPAFSPGMVGSSIAVSNSDYPANNGVWTITGYVHPGCVVVDNPSVTSDTDIVAHTVVKSEYHPGFGSFPEIGLKDRLSLSVS